MNSTARTFTKQPTVNSLCRNLQPPRKVAGDFIKFSSRGDQHTDTILKSTRGQTRTLGMINGLSAPGESNKIKSSLKPRI